MLRLVEGDSGEVMRDDEVRTNYYGCRRSSDLTNSMTKRKGLGGV